MLKKKEKYPDLSSLRAFTAKHLKDNIGKFSGHFVTEPDKLRTEEKMILDSINTEFKSKYPALKDDVEAQKIKFELYCIEVEKNGTWAGQLEIRAMEELLDQPIVIINEKDNTIIVSDKYDSPDDKTQPIFILYNGVNHYSQLDVKSDKLDEAKHWVDTYRADKQSAHSFSKM